jgi:hypothetical protein
MVLALQVLQVLISRILCPRSGEDRRRPLMPYAIQATPVLVWREILFMTTLFIWALAALRTNLHT